MEKENRTAFARCTVLLLLLTVLITAITTIIYNEQICDNDENETQKLITTAPLSPALRAKTIRPELTTDMRQAIVIDDFNDNTSEELPVGLTYYEPVPEHTVNERYASIEISDDEMKELAALVYLEARGEPAAGQQAVAEVVLNRVLSSEFPNTVHDVIYDTKYGVQFTPYKRVASTTPTDAQYEAIDNALYGDLILDEDVLYFSRKAYNSKIFITIGGHTFCRG